MSGTTKLLVVLTVGLSAACATPLERDPKSPTLDGGFFVGINHPWVNYGHDFGVAWGANGVSSHPEVIEADLADLADHDLKVLRWFIFADGRAAPEFGGDMVIGLDDETLTDFGALLDLCTAADVKLVPVLFDFYWFEAANDVNGVQTGGRAATVTDPAARESLLDQGLRPLLQAYGDHPAILAWDVINEPEWAMQGHANIVAEPIPDELMQEFVGEVTTLIHEHSPHPVTVGSADLDNMLRYWTSSGLDALQFHAYDGVPTRPWSELGVEVPVLVGELPTAVSEERLEDYITQSYVLGYAAVLPWSYRAEDDSTDFDAAGPVLARWRELLGE